MVLEHCVNKNQLYNRKGLVTSIRNITILHIMLNTWISIVCFSIFSPMYLYQFLKSIHLKVLNLFTPEIHLEKVTVNTQTGKNDQKD